MQRTRFAPSCLVVLIACWSSAPAAYTQTHPDRGQTLVLDAIFTHTRSSGPAPTHAGHRQTTIGILRTATGRRAGSFTFTCTWIERDGAVETCGGTASTQDGRLDTAGPARSNSLTHTWTITGGTGAYRHAAGTVVLRDLSDRESLVAATITTQDHAELHIGTVKRPVANDPFIARANVLCATLAHRLAALPPFPFAGFDASA
jgi:hypothetical protein